MRRWKCPECGREVQLAVTQLDPIACDACLAKMKGNRSSSAVSDLSNAVAGPLGTWQALPEMVKLAAVAAALVIGLLIGFIAGQIVSTRSADSAGRPEHTNTKVVVEDEPSDERPPAPGPGYKWVRGRTHKDGTRGPGHWAKDPFYKGDDDSAGKKTSK